MLVTSQKYVIFAVQKIHSGLNSQGIVFYLQNRMKKVIKSLFPLLTLWAFASTSFAQQVGTNSLYSRYGYGQLSNPAIGASESMGGISYGLRRSQEVNPGNPASYSSLDTLTFVFDYGISGHYSIYSDGSNKQNLYNGNLDYVAMQFPLIGKIAGSFGLLPYSKVGYSFGREQSTTDFTYQEIYSGSGGLSQVYGGIAWELFKFASIGANVSYLFGNIEHTRQLPLINSNTLARIKTDKFRFSDVKFDFGLQLTYPLSREESITMGLVYSPKINSESTIYPYDRLINSSGQVTQQLESDTLTHQSFQLPNTFGAGISYRNNNLLVGIDGSYQTWKDMQYPDYLDGMTSETRFNNRYRLSAGAEYVNDPLSRNLLQRIRFRAGLSFANSYNNVNIYHPTNSSLVGTDGFKEYGFNVGFGIPFRDMYNGRVSLLNIGFGYSLLEPNATYMIKEEVFKISLSMSINELWFFKRQFE